MIGDIDDSKAPLVDHLIELRRRLIYCLLAVGLCFGVAFTQSKRIFSFLVQPLVNASGPQGAHVIYTKLYEAFFVEIKVALFAALAVSFPIIASQLWAFVAPGLYRREKAALLPFMLATPVLFTLGGALAYFVVMPLALHFLLGYQIFKPQEGYTQQALPAMADYLAFTMQFIFAFGIAFLLPLLLLLLERAGIVTRKQLVSGRRYAIVGAFVIAAVLTPPDVLSQTLLAVPLILLYESALVIIWFTERKRARTAAQLPAPAE